MICSDDMWHLAGLRAEVASLAVQLHDLQEAMGRPITEEYVQKCVEHRKTQKDAYLDACQRAQLKSMSKQVEH